MGGTLGEIRPDALANRVREECGREAHRDNPLRRRSLPEDVSTGQLAAPRLRVVASGAYLDPKLDECFAWDVVGPLCFRGDIVAHETQLPASIQSGVHIAIHDAGAYTLAMFSKYNSRQAPPVYGFTDGGATIRLLSDGETIEQALSMWQLPGESHGGGREELLAVAAAIGGALLAVALVRKV